jgi:histidine triad (HIT) family protein
LRRLRRGLFWLSRTRPLGWLVRAAFAYLSMLLPVRRVAETATLIAFEHPVPSWSPHVLLVPKRSLASFVQIQASDARLVGDIVRLAFSIAARRKLYTHGFALLVNGGAYQDVRQLHFHLAGLDDGLDYAAPRSKPNVSILETSGLVAFEHPLPRRDVHVALMPTERLSWSDLAGPAGEQVGRELVTAGQRVVEQLRLTLTGFTIVASVPPGGAHHHVCLHLVAGGRRGPGLVPPEGRPQANPAPMGCADGRADWTETDDGSR